MTFLLFGAGLLLVIAGAEALIRGASRLAEAFGIPPLIVGLTVVAFGTGSPELAVSLKSVLSDQASLALGNVVGSNIFNVLLILGLSAVVTPLSVSRQLVRLDVPLMIAGSALVLVLAADGAIGRTEGLVLFVGLLAYSGLQVYQGRRNSPSAENASPEPDRAEDAPSGGHFLSAGLVIGGLTLLVFGSRWMVNGAIEIARMIGISELVVGLTIIAAGTSLPEVVTSVMASLRGQRDIAVGNVVGSNVFNLTGVLGLSAFLAPSGLPVLPAVIGFDLPVMVAVAFACLPVFFTGGVISRWEGAVLLGYYGAYTTYLLLAATQHDALPLFNRAMLYFVLPITGVTLLALTVQALRRGNPPYT